MLEELEKQIEARVIMLKSEITDKEKAQESIECISDLLKERNQKCKLYKNVKEDKTVSDNSGVKYVSVTIGILGTIAALVAIICCVIIPNNIYKTGVSLYESEKYKEAAEIFESLDGFADSKKMLIACDEGIKSVKYSDAQKLFKDKEYEQAISIFEDLGNYKDSKEMIESVKQKIAEDKYNLAESKFNSQDYYDAIKLYTELGNYKDCKEKIEKIQNRLASDDVLYFGTYNGNPIAWQVVKNENNRMLLIAKDSVCELPYNDEIKDVKWNECSLNDWLNNEWNEIVALSYDLERFGYGGLESAALIGVKSDGTVISVFYEVQSNAESFIASLKNIKKVCVNVAPVSKTVSIAAIDKEGVLYTFNDGVCDTYENLNIIDVETNDFYSDNDIARQFFVLKNDLMLSCLGSDNIIIEDAVYINKDFIVTRSGTIYHSYNLFNKDPENTNVKTAVKDVWLERK